MPKLHEIVNASGIKNEKRILELLRSSEKYKGKVTTSLMGTTTVEGDLSEIVAFVKTADAARSALEEAEKAEQAKAEAERIQAQQEYNSEVAKVLVTSGYSFEGYKITKYSGYISGDDAISVNRGFGSFGGDIGEYLLRSLTIIRQNAIRELKEAAHDLGCNAVIGVDFDYIDLAPETANASGGTTYYPYVFCVTANGTAVMIEKE